MMTRVLLALLLTFAYFPPPVAAAKRVRAVQHRSNPIATAARQAAETALAAGTPAVQIAVSQRGRIIYSNAFGLTDRQSATAATPRSVLQVGSITKQFTAAAIVRLAERGALSLDDRIEKYVPEFNPGGATITLRHLLTHTSGIRAVPINQNAPLTRQQYVALISGQPLDFAPGSKWSYSNDGYRLLGYAIESISGRSYADFVHTEFALPLGLLDTGVCGTSNLPLPAGYGVQQGTSTRLTPTETSVAFAAGAICSTASDLALWSHLLATGRVVLPASYTAMTTAARLTNNSVAPYGLGLSLQPQLGRPAVWHTGAIAGFHSSLVYFPDHELAVAVVINALPTPPGVSAHFIAIDVARAALGVP